MDHVVVRPVLALRVELIRPPLDTKEGKLAADIRAEAASAGYLQDTTDGWFVPLVALMPRIDAVADFLLFETRYWNEFELDGGLEITTISGITDNAMVKCWFRYVEELINAIRALRDESNAQRASIDNDLYLDLTLEEETISITRKHSARRIEPVEMCVSVQELLDGILAAQDQTQRFADEIEPLLTIFTDVSISSHLVRWMFGLE